MKKNKLLLIVNIALFINFITQVSTGLFHSKIPHHTFEIFHFYGGIILLALTTAHIYLNFNWIKSNILKKL
jgi:hypothetical protein